MIFRYIILITSASQRQSVIFSVQKIIESVSIVILQQFEAACFILHSDLLNLTENLIYNFHKSFSNTTIKQSIEIRNNR